MSEDLKESIHHIICGAFCHNLIDDVINLSSDSLNNSSKALLKKLWLEKLHFKIHSQEIAPPQKRKHWRLLEECEPYPHPCSHFGSPEKYMEKPVIDFNRGAKLEYVANQRRNSARTSQLINNDSQPQISQPVSAAAATSTSAATTLVPPAAHRHQIIATHCSIPFRGCCVYVQESSLSTYCGQYRVTQIVNMPPVNQSISRTGQPLISDSTIPPSLLAYASLIHTESNSQSHTNPTKKLNRKKNLIVVSLRNWEGHEISEILWPISFVPFPSSLSPNEHTLSTDSLSTLYGLSNIHETSFLILPPKNYSFLPSTFDDHDVQRILHKYRVKFSPEDISEQPSTASFEIPELIPADNDLLETDRFASLLSVNFDNDGDDDNGGNDGQENDGDELNSNRMSLDDMLADLTNKLSYFDNEIQSQEESSQGLETSLFPQFGENNNTLELANHHHVVDILPYASHTNVYKGLAEQIYFAELDAEEFFLQLTSNPLTSQDIVFVHQSRSLSHTNDSNLKESTDQEFELTSELKMPANQIVGLTERDIKLHDEMKIKLHSVLLTVNKVDLIAKDCQLILTLPEPLRS